MCQHAAKGTQILKKEKRSFPLPACPASMRNRAITDNIWADVQHAHPVPRSAKDYPEDAKHAKRNQRCPLNMFMSVLSLPSLSSLMRLSLSLSLCLSVYPSPSSLPTEHSISFRKPEVMLPSFFFHMLQWLHCSWSRLALPDTQGRQLQTIDETILHKIIFYDHLYQSSLYLSQLHAITMKS